MYIMIRAIYCRSNFIIVQIGFICNSIHVVPILVSSCPVLRHTANNDARRAECPFLYPRLVCLIGRADSGFFILFVHYTRLISQGKWNPLSTCRSVLIWKLHVCSMLWVSTITCFYKCSTHSNKCCTASLMPFKPRPYGLSTLGPSQVLISYL